MVRATLSIGLLTKRAGRSMWRRIQLRVKLGSQIRAAAATAAIGVFRGACGGPHNTGGTAPSAKIGVVLTFNLPGFWGNYLKYEGQYATQLNANLVGPQIAGVESPGNEVTQQITDVKSLIAQGVKALIINPADSSAIKPALDYAASKGVPVVTVDVAPDQGSVYMIVRADNTQYGTKACDYIAAHASSPGTIAHVEGDLTSLNARDRAAGCNQVISSKYPNFTVKSYQTNDGDTYPARQNATTDLTAIPA